MNRRRALSLLASVAMIALCVAGAVAPRAAYADWALVEERFYALTLAGKPCGRSHEKLERDGARLRTTSRIELRFTRLGEDTAVDLESAFIETEAGAAVEARVSQGGADAVVYRFLDGGRVAIERGGAVEERALPAEAHLPPRAARRFIAARQQAGGASIAFRFLDAQSGLSSVEIAMTRKGVERRAVLGREIELVRYEVRNSLMPMAARELYDAEGVLVESATPIGIGDLVSRLATRAEADASYAAARFDILAGTFVEAAPIEDFLERKTLVVRVRAKGEAIADLPEGGAQTVERVDARTLRVLVDTDRGSAPDAGDATDQRWLRATEVIDFGHPAVQELLARLKIADNMPPLKQAVAMRAGVERHLASKNLGSAFASAGEAAANRSGDCTEHAVLLAALLRARGIPSRVASGLVYVPPFAKRPAGWGWHLWTQALVPPAGEAGAEPRWFDLDATLPARGPRFHPAHVLVATSDLAGGAADPAFTSALGLIGAIEIEVEKDGDDANAPRGDRAPRGAEQP
ncbi:MAG: hypothetical protein GC172_07195 [Phycisphaera sp.]|nr:hypothetical protein [Phycisphaera sp.]